MFKRDHNANAASCCSLPTVLRWAARGLNAFVAGALVYLGSLELSGIALSPPDYLALVATCISVTVIAALYVREFSAALVVLAFGSLIGLALTLQLAPKHALLLLLCVPAILVWLATRLTPLKRPVQKELFSKREHVSL